MALLPLLRELRKMEETIEITDPVTAKADAFLIVPDRNERLGKAAAAFENFPIPAGDEGRLGDFRQDIESVRVRCTTYAADFDQACEMAIAFYDAFKDAIDAERPAMRRLNQTFDHMMLRGDTGQPLSNFEGRPGWELLLDFTIFEVSE